MYEIDSGIQWTSQDDCETEVMTGVLRGVSDTHFTIEFPGLGIMDIPQDDGEFLSVDAPVFTHSEPVKSEPVRSGKLYSAVGVATDTRGVTKLRFTGNLKARRAAFKAAGWTDVNMMEVEEPLGKTSLVELLSEHPDFQDSVSQELIDEYLNP